MLRGLSCTLARTRTPFRKVTISAVLPRPSPGKLHMNMRTGRARRGVKLFIEGKLEATLGSATEHLRRISWIGNVGGLAGGVPEGIDERAGRGRQVPEGVIGIGVGDRACRATERGDRAETIGVVVARCPRPQHR